MEGHSRTQAAAGKGERGSVHLPAWSVPPFCPPALSLEGPNSRPLTVECGRNGGGYQSLGDSVCERLQMRQEAGWGDPCAL